MEEETLEQYSVSPGSGPGAADSDATDTDPGKPQPIYSSTKDFHSDLEVRPPGPGPAELDIRSVKRRRAHWQRAGAACQ